MLWTPMNGEIMMETDIAITGDASPGAQPVTGAAASTKGAYVQNIASTAFDTFLIGVFASNYAASATDSNLMVDIAVGAATEEIIIPDLMMGLCSQAVSRAYYFPLYIPAGTRIACRAAGQRVTTAVSVGVVLYGGAEPPPWRVGRKVTTYGVTTVPNGTTVVPGASAAQGAFTEITASTTEDHFALIPGFQPGVDTTKGLIRYVVTMGLGAATEEALSQPYMFGIDTAESMSGPLNPFPTFTEVPSGTRIAVRASASGALDSGNYNACVYAVS
jgi:hypothetical protein